MTKPTFAQYRERGSLSLRINSDFCVRNNKRVPPGTEGDAFLSCLVLTQHLIHGIALNQPLKQQKQTGMTELGAGNMPEALHRAAQASPTLPPELLGPAR